MDRSSIPFPSPFGRSVIREQRDEEDYPLYSLKDISFKDNRRELWGGLMAVVGEMMFGFGDSVEPYKGSVEVMDELLKDFITNLVCAEGDAED